MRAWREVARRYGVRRVRRAAAGAARSLHRKERRRDRRPALQLHRQGRPRGRAASGDDADVRADGRRAERTRCASRYAGSRCRSSFATSGSSAVGSASTSSSTSTSSARRASTADAELLACAIEIMREFGLTAREVVVRACPTAGCCAPISTPSASRDDADAGGLRRRRQARAAAATASRARSCRAGMA